MAVSQEIIQEIQTDQQSGKSIGEIREGLKTRGVPIADIDAAIQSLSPVSTMPTESTTPAASAAPTAPAAMQPLPTPEEAATSAKGFHLPMWLMIVIGTFFAIGYAYMWYVILFKTFSLPGLSS